MHLKRAFIAYVSLGQTFQLVSQAAQRNPVKLCHQTEETPGGREPLGSSAYTAALQDSKLNRISKALYHKLTALPYRQLRTAPNNLTNQPEQ